MILFYCGNVRENCFTVTIVALWQLLHCDNCFIVTIVSWSTCVIITIILLSRLIICFNHLRQGKFAGKFVCIIKYKQHKTFKAKTNYAICVTGINQMILSDTVSSYLYKFYSKDINIGSWLQPKWFNGETYVKCVVQCFKHITCNFIDINFNFIIGKTFLITFFIGIIGIKLLWKFYHIGLISWKYSWSDHL